MFALMLRRGPLLLQDGPLCSLWRAGGMMERSDALPSATAIDSSRDWDQNPTWSLVNSRDRGIVISLFLQGFSPYRIAKVVHKSPASVYKILNSPDAQEEIQKFGEGMERDVEVTRDRLMGASPFLVDGLLQIALESPNEGVRLKAIMGGLGMNGISPIQKVEKTQRTVLIDDKFLGRLERLLLADMEADGLTEKDVTPQPEKINGRVNQSLLQSVADRLNDTGDAAGGIVETECDKGREVAPDVPNPLQTELVLPCNGDSWVRQDDAVSAQATVPDVAAPGCPPQVDSVAAGALQVNSGNEGVPDMEVAERCEPKNPYYKCDSN
jgi:hypothetical protein